MSAISNGGVLLEVRDLKTYFYRRGRFGVVRREDYVPAVDGVSFRLREEKPSVSWEKAAAGRPPSAEPFFASSPRPRAKCTTKEKTS